MKLTVWLISLMICSQSLAGQANDSLAQQLLIASAIDYFKTSQSKREIVGPYSLIKVLNSHSGLAPKFAWTPGFLSYISTKEQRQLKRTSVAHDFSVRIIKADTIDVMLDIIRFYIVKDRISFWKTKYRAEVNNSAPCGQFKGDSRHRPELYRRYYFEQFKGNWSFHDRSWVNKGQN